MNERDTRRAFLTFGGAGVLLAACRNHEQGEAERSASSAGSASATTKDAGQPKEDEEPDVSATEDLMREHGVIRRVLVIYREAARHLRADAASVRPDALQKAARLIRTFGEEYHEKQLEEANIFPVLIKANGALSKVVNTLISQHQRGREITDYILAITNSALGAQSAEPLARVLEAFARMYEEHTAIEDTIVFPAWKKAFTEKELDEMGDRFEDIEHKVLGKDGFEHAVDEVAAIETSLGVTLANLTAPPPPKP